MNTRRQRKLRRTRKQRGGSFLKQERSPLIEAILANNVDAVKNLITAEPDSILQERSMGIGSMLAFTGYLTKKNIANYLLDFTLKEYSPEILTPEDQGMLDKREEIIKSILKTKPEIIKKIPDAIEYQLLDIEQKKTEYHRLFKYGHLKNLFHDKDILFEQIRKLEILNYLIRVIVGLVDREDQFMITQRLSTCLKTIKFFEIADEILTNPGNTEEAKAKNDELRACVDKDEWLRLKLSSERIDTLICGSLRFDSKKGAMGVYRYLWNLWAPETQKKGQLVPPDYIFKEALKGLSYMYQDSVGIEPIAPSIITVPTTRAPNTVPTTRAPNTVPTTRAPNTVPPSITVPNLQFIKVTSGKETWYRPVNGKESVWLLPKEGVIVGQESE